MQPAVQPSAADVQEELRAICAYSAFVHSDRLSELLRFVVGQKLSGHDVNEQLVGVSIFGRKPGYDSANDTIVRTQAVRLRKRLDEYYRDNPHARVRVSIAKGTYTPTFSWVYDESRGTAEIPDLVEETQLPGPSGFKTRPLAVAVAVMLAAAAAISLYFFVKVRHPPTFRTKYPIVVADVANVSGGSGLGDIVRRTLAIQLEQTPMLQALPDAKIAAALKMMIQPPTARLTPERAREICERTNSKAVIEPSIARVGNPYLIALKAIGCEAGETLASAEAKARSPDAVLGAVETAVTQVSRELQNVLPSLARSNTPLEQVTTSSLDALKAYSSGIKLIKEKGEADALPYFQRAIELDPNFASAYLELGAIETNSNEIAASQANLRKSFDLRDRATERERLEIMSVYYLVVTGEWEKSLTTTRQWARSYPDDVSAHVDLADEYATIGDYENAVAEGREAIRLDPNHYLVYGNTFGAYCALNRLSDARALIQQARAHGDYVGVEFPGYTLAFLDGDESEMRRALVSARGKRWLGDAVVSSASDTDAYHGRLTAARELSAEAIDAAERNGAKETAALWRVNEALREAEFGNAARARELARFAMAEGSDRDVGVLGALALARAGDSADARPVMDRLASRFPLDSYLHHYWFPTIRAAVALNAGSPSAAIEALQGKTAYELGHPPQFNLGPMYPVYIRGEAFLKANEPDGAVAQFRNIIEHRGVTVNFPLASLAHLQLARALAMQRDQTGARREYDAFFALWKDADRDIPVLRAAHAEYARLLR